MNRTLFMGIAVFLAVVGIALVGGEKQAVAGHGCHGCHGSYNCDGGGCHGDNGGCHAANHGCAGRQRCHGRRRHGLFSHRRRCHGRSHGCHGYVAPSCCGCSGQAIEAAPAEEAPAEAPPAEAPPAPAA